MLDTGLIFASDSRTHAELDNFARFCKMTAFERAGDRVIVLLSSGNLASYGGRIVNFSALGVMQFRFNIIRAITRNISRNAFRCPTE